MNPLLSPHRAYRSVHGASDTSSLNRLIRRREFKESLAYESFVCYASCHGPCVRRKPISPSAVGSHMCAVFRHTELHEVPSFGFRLLPLLPDVYTDSVPQPFVPFPHCRTFRRESASGTGWCRWRKQFFTCFDIPYLLISILSGKSLRRGARTDALRTMAVFLGVKSLL